MFMVIVPAVVTYGMLCILAIQMPGIGKTPAYSFVCDRPFVEMQKFLYQEADRRAREDRGLFDFESFGFCSCYVNVSVMDICL